MNESTIYQVFEYDNDEHSPLFNEHGYFKNVDNAIKNIENVISSRYKIKIEVDKSMLIEIGIYSYSLSSDGKHVIGIWRIETDD